MSPMRVAKQVVHAAVGAAGLEIRKKPDPAARRINPRDAGWTLDPDEERRLAADLDRFAAAHPDDCRPWSRPDSAREYLTARRVASYHDLLAKLDAAGIGLAGRALADVGSGTGYLLRLVAARHPDARLVGFDAYHDITIFARHLAPSATFVETNLYDIDPGVHGLFDVVVCMEVIEHLKDPAAALGKLRSLVVPGGHVVLCVPDGRRDTFDLGEPYDDGTGYWGHLNFWSPEAWPLWLDRHHDGEVVAAGQLATSENYAVLRLG